MGTTEILGGSFSANEDQVLFTSNETGVFNAYTLPITGGKTRQVTHSTTESTYALSYFPEDNRILVQRDHGGDENNHLFLIGIDGREKDLTPGDKVKAQFHGWSHDGKAFYYQTNERDLRFFDLFKMSAASLAPTLLYRDIVGYQFGCISGDERYIAFYRAKDREDFDAYLYDLTTNEMLNITEHEGPDLNIPSTFDVDSRYLYYITDKDSEFSYLVRYEIKTGQTEIVDRCNSNISDVRFSHNGRYRIEWIDKDACVQLKIVHTPSGRTIPLSNVPEGIITTAKVSKSERLLIFQLNHSRAGHNLFLYDLVANRFSRLTDALHPKINEESLVEPLSLKFRSFDGLEIPSLLWRPHQANSDAKVPALVWVHGGPGGQTRKGYRDFTQYLVNSGYAVLAPNYRGSSGYGKSFLAADNKRHGRDPLWDCVEAKNYLASLDYVDGRRIGIIGGSYGGYMVLAALAFTPLEFAVGIDMFGISNWIRTLESFPPYWAAFLDGWHKKVGDPRTEREMLVAISPIFHVDRIRRPLMVLQGANDPRVIKSESDDIVKAVRENGGNVEYLIFDDEGHGFAKRKNKIRAYKAIYGFLERYLKGDWENELRTTRSS
ncbi:MAG TPA: alpha/beta fold hydrolase [Pyrinomonadaceae bacterium]|nr:alpha/beta fold hydrolase [Pyrinomonadaceae bacterium]